MGKLILQSPFFSHQSSIPPEFTCDGLDVSPALMIDGVPEGTKSLVLIVEDPDAPRGTWDHWILFNIDPSVRRIEKGGVPSGSVEATNDFGRNYYGGPCPPSGTHHYFFKLYALDAMLDMPGSARKKDIEQAMEGRVLDKTELIGLYARR